MSSLLIHEPLGSRRLALPVQIGGAGSQIAVPGLGDDRVIIERRGAQWWLRVDAGSEVRVNGRAQSAGVALNDGDVIGLGATQAVLVTDGPEPALTLRHLQGNATVAPLAVLQLPGESVTAGARDIMAAGAAAIVTQTPASENRKLLRTGTVITAGLILLALLLGAGLLAIVPVTLQVAPANARVVARDIPRWQAGDRLFLWPGTRIIEVSSPGYHSQRMPLHVSSNMLQPTVIALDLLPGLLRIDTGDVSAEVLVDGMPSGKAPGKISVTAGRHSLLLRAPRYLERLLDVQVQGGGREQQIDGRLAPGWGWLALDTRPAGARITVDGQDRGIAPQHIELDAGLRTLAITSPGRRAWNSQIAIVAGQTLELGVVDLSLPPPPALRAAIVQAIANANPAPAVPEPPPPPAPPAARIQSPLLGTLILLPPGTFNQGSERREQGRRANETLRQVTLSRAFYLAETEVTNAQFRTFLATHASGIAGDRTLDLDRQAVSTVTWDEAVEFCNWLSQREGLPGAYERREGRWQFVQPRNHGYRLPTEAEWEYAVRYVDGQQWRRFTWGDSLPPPANAENLAGDEALNLPVGAAGRIELALPGYRDEHAVVAPVGSYRRSAAGFADLGGNVSEWVHDIYSSLPDAAAVTDPEGAAVAGPHVVRGANWRSATVSELRAAWRDRSATAEQTIGFRVARSVEVKP